MDASAQARKSSTRVFSWEASVRGWEPLRSSRWRYQACLVKDLLQHPGHLPWCIAHGWPWLGDQPSNGAGRRVSFLPRRLPMSRLDQRDDLENEEVLKEEKGGVGELWSGAPVPDMTRLLWAHCQR